MCAATLGVKHIKRLKQMVDLLVHIKPLWLLHLGGDDTCWELTLLQQQSQGNSTLRILHKNHHLQ